MSQRFRIRLTAQALSDLEQTFSYCLLDTPVPLFNYVAHVRLAPVTDGDRTFWDWRCSFTTRPGLEEEMRQMVSEQIYDAGFAFGNTGRLSDMLQMVIAANP